MPTPDAPAARVRPLGRPLSAREQRLHDAEQNVRNKEREWKQAIAERDQAFAAAYWDPEEPMKVAVIARAADVNHSTVQTALRPSRQERRLQGKPDRPGGR